MSALRAEQAGAQGGDFKLTRSDFRTIAAALFEDAGITLPDSKEPLVYSRLAKRLRALRLSSFADYCALITSAEGEEERRHMLAALTTNVTRFFREPHHFDHLKTEVLPKLIAKAERGERVRIWSAGCSIGQEPYSIALTILSIAPHAPNLDIKILATDIDPNVIRDAKAGVYPAAAGENIPPDLRRKFFPSTEGRNGGSIAASDEVKSLIAYRELNLNGPSWPMQGPFEVIFCRNVVIYFDEPTQQVLWGRFEKLLTPDGVLYIGHSERVSGPALDRFSSEGITTYRRVRIVGKGA